MARFLPCTRHTRAQAHACSHDCADSMPVSASPAAVCTQQLVHNCCSARACKLPACCLGQCATSRNLQTALCRHSPGTPPAPAPPLMACGSRRRWQACRHPRGCHPARRAREKAAGRGQRCAARQACSGRGSLRAQLRAPAGTQSCTRAHADQRTHPAGTGGAPWRRTGQTWRARCRSRSARRSCHGARAA